MRGDERGKGRDRICPFIELAINIGQAVAIGFVAGNLRAPCSIRDFSDTSRERCACVHAYKFSGVACFALE